MRRWKWLFCRSSYILFPGLNFFRVQNIGVLFFSSQVSQLIWIYYLNLRVSILQWVGIRQLAAGIIMTQIAAMEVALTSYVLRTQVYSKCCTCTGRTIVTKRRHPLESLQQSLYSVIRSICHPTSWFILIVAMIGYQDSVGYQDSIHSWSKRIIFRLISVNL